MVQLATTQAEIERCHPVMRELRPHFGEAGPFVEQVRRQMESDHYHLAYVEQDGHVVACAGFREGESLAWGPFLYVDDLVTASDARSQGHGRELLDWLVGRARKGGRHQLHLDSGVQRRVAHRFYFRERMAISSFHFARDLRAS